MRDDTLIALGRSAYASMNRETTYGGYLESSYKRIVINVMSGATDAPLPFYTTSQTRVARPWL